MSAKRSGRFRVHADEDLVFDSGVIHQTDKQGGSRNPTRPIRVVVPLVGVKKLRLSFQCEDDKDKAGLCGGWGDANFVTAAAPEYKLDATITPDSGVQQDFSDSVASPGFVIHTLPIGAAKKFCRLVVTP